MGASVGSELTHLDDASSFSAGSCKEAIHGGVIRKSLFLSHT